MSSHEKNQTTRRGFLGSIATGAAAMSIATISPSSNFKQAPNLHIFPTLMIPRNYSKILMVSTASYLT
jgi:hypothetical protein